MQSFIKMIFALMILAVPVSAPAQHQRGVNVPDLSLWISVRKVDPFIVGEKHRDMKTIKYGAEGGEIIRDQKGLFHWFTAEQFDEPYWLANRIAHWTSKDGLAWQRDNRWSKDSNQDTKGADRAAYFDPTVVFDEQTNYWYMFYVGYRYHAAGGVGWYMGKVYRARAVNAGLEGLGGPYHDQDDSDVVVMEPIANPSPYEKRWVGRTGDYVCGACSVTVFPANGQWQMIYAENLRATASSPSGTFTRVPEGPGNPISYGRPPMDWGESYAKATVYNNFYLENPIVTRIPKGRPGAGTYVMAVGFYTDKYTGVTKQTCGYATSSNGIEWSEVRPIGTFTGDCITALSLIPAEDGSLIFYFTSRPTAAASFESLSRATLNVVEARLPPVK